MASVKNQIKAFTATATKNDLTNYFLFLGGVSGGLEAIDETDISLLSRITKDEVATVVPRIDWVFNAEYKPFTIGLTAESECYVYNPDNSIVYLCVGKNQPSGLIGDKSYKSTTVPTHNIGTLTLDDGYMWQALYKIDESMTKFLNSSAMPVSSLYDYRQDNLAGTFTTKYNNICTAVGATGSCFFYYNKTSTDPVSGITYEKGDRVLGFPETNWFCSTCHETGEKFGYKSYHIDYVNKQSTILRNPIDELTIDDSRGYLNVNSSEYIQTKNYQYTEQINHGIFSLQLDVSKLTVEERIVSTANPEIIILDARGYGATARVKTYYDILRDAFVANGIELLTNGQNFVNPQFVINEAVSTNLQKSIKAVVLDPPYLADPSIILPNPKVSIVKKITNDDLVNIFSTDQKTFTKVGIVENVLLQDGTNLATGLIAGEKVEKRATSKIAISAAIEPMMFMLMSSPSKPNIGIGPIAVSDLGDSAIDISTIGESDQDYNSKLVALIDNGDDTFDLEIAGADELTYNVITQATSIIIDDTTYNIDSIANPEVKVDFVNFVATKNLQTPINMDEVTSKSNSVTINFLI